MPSESSMIFGIHLSASGRSRGLVKFWVVFSKKKWWNIYLDQFPNCGHICSDSFSDFKHHLTNPMGMLVGVTDHWWTGLRLGPAWLHPQPRFQGSIKQNDRVLLWQPLHQRTCILHHSIKWRLLEWLLYQVIFTRIFTSFWSTASYLKRPKVYRERQVW